MRLARGLKSCATPPGLDVHACLSKPGGLEEISKLIGPLGPELDVHVLSSGASTKADKPKVWILLGADHDSKPAARQISTIIKRTRPQSVGLELCARRFKRMFPLGTDAYMQLDTSTKHRIGNSVHYGRDQMAAAIAAAEIGSTAVCCDRDIGQTEAQFLAYLPEDAFLAASVA
eukprot:824177-Amphidinium_carterae.1